MARGAQIQPALLNGKFKLLGPRGTAFHPSRGSHCGTDQPDLSTLHPLLGSFQQRFGSLAPKD